MSTPFGRGLVLLTCVVSAVQGFRSVYLTGRQGLQHLPYMQMRERTLWLGIRPGLVVLGGVSMALLWYRMWRAPQALDSAI